MFTVVDENSLVLELLLGLVHVQAYVGEPVPPVGVAVRAWAARVAELASPLIAALRTVPTVLDWVLAAVRAEPDVLSVTVHVTAYKPTLAGVKVGFCADAEENSLVLADPSGRTHVQAYVYPAVPPEADAVRFCAFKSERAAKPPVVRAKSPVPPPPVSEGPNTLLIPILLPAL